MNKSLKFMGLFFTVLSLIVVSCSNKAEESKIAKAITLTVTKGAIVLPNNLPMGNTCVASGVSGPRVRMRATIKWEGQGNLVPLVIRLQINDSRLSGDFNGPISPSDDNAESLSGMFGVSDDFLAPKATAYVMQDCFLDYGGLPKPNSNLTGATYLEIPATLIMMGIVREPSVLVEAPFIKEVPTTVIYVAGSVPST
jgi:hypothetical protein